MGVWRGWYEQFGERHEVRIQRLKVKDGRITGKGKDDVGKFDIIGFYSADGVVNFIKRYKGQHEVSYSGVREGQSITGKWNIHGEWNGTFQLYKERQWSGHYSQNGAQHEMIFEILRFKNDKITGSGEDANGKFLLNGHIQHNGHLEFTKQYIGKHAVHYKG